MSPNNNAVNKDELEPPQWLNDDFFTNVLKHHENNEKIALKSLKIMPATVKNDHYASIMFRAVIEYHVNGQLKNKSMVLKAMPEMEGQKKDIFEKSYIFETEIAIYTEVVPKFQTILRAAGIDITLGPTCIYHSLSPKKTIIFEDISPMGYEAIRQRSMTLDEVRAAYAKLATWHAVSYKLIKDEPGRFEELRHGLMNLKSFQEADAFKNGIVHFIEMLATQNDLAMYQPYFEKLHKEGLLADCVASFDEFRNNPEPSAYYVLCHGDFHYKNIMIKQCKEKNCLDDLMLLDYQLCYVGPIVNDIIYSVYMLLDASQRVNHLDELLHFYFTNFQETLHQIGFTGEMPKMLEFRQQLARHKNFEIFLLTSFLPVWIAFKDANFDPEESMTSESLHRKLYQSAEYIEELRVILPKYLQLGYLDDV